MSNVALTEEQRACVREIDRMVQEDLRDRNPPPVIRSAYKAALQAQLQAGVLVRIEASPVDRSTIVHFLKGALASHIDFGRTFERLQDHAAGEGPLMLELVNGSAIEFVM